MKKSEDKKEESQNRFNLKSKIFKQMMEIMQLKRNVDVAEFFSVSPQTALSWSKDGRWDEFTVYSKVKTKINASWLLTGEGNPEISDSINSESEVFAIKEENEKLKIQIEYYKQLVDSLQQTIDAQKKLLDISN